jgi:integrase
VASIKPYKDKWRAQVYVAGVRDSATFRLKREAEAWAAVRKTQILAAKALPAGARHTLRQALEKYRDEVSPGKRGARWEEVRINAMLAWKTLPLDLPIGEVTTTHMAAWRDARQAEVKAGTVRREISLLSAFFTRARLEWKWIEASPLADMEKPSPPDHRDTVIAWSQIRRQLGALGHRRGPCRSSMQAAARCFLLALRTGMRAGEICGLTWDRVFDDHCATPHKTGQTKESLRYVPLEPKAKRIIESMRGWDRQTVFGVSSQTLDAFFRRCRQRAGMSGFTFHDSRHTAATWLARRIDVLTLCKMFGWKNPEQAMVYYNPTASDIARRLAGK